MRSFKYIPNQLKNGLSWKVRMVHAFAEVRSKRRVVN